MRRQTPGTTGSRPDIGDSAVAARPDESWQHGKFQVLIVCSANHCRSPLAEFLLCEAIRGAADGWSIASAGTHALNGIPMHESAADLLAERGIDSDWWSSQRLTGALVAGADLVLTAELSHRSEVVTLDPRALRKTFTLLQFARLSEQVGPVTALSGHQQGVELLARATAARSQLQPNPPELDEIDDPMGRGAHAFQLCADTITRAIDEITRPLAAA
jgi:protein-tyrosine phosphatase